MVYGSLKDFSKDIKTVEPKELITKWLESDWPHAFSDQETYGEFWQVIADDWPESETIALAGTGNWRYSLNPFKNFREFDAHSDIDVIVISPEYFERTWVELRSYHRANWSQWNNTQRDTILRSGQNVYCGFVSPKFISDKGNRYRFDFLKKCNSYSSSLIDHREVNLMFFKSREETIDYYERGVRLAKGKL